MKRKAIKWLCLALAVAMLFCVVGCDTQNADDNTTTSSSTTTTTTEEAPTSTEGSTTDTTADTTESTDTTTTTEADVTTTKGSTTKESTTTSSKVTTKPTSTVKPTSSKTTAASTASTTKSTTKATTKTTTKATLSAAEVKKLRDQVGFGYYIMQENDLAKEAKKGHINMHIADFSQDQINNPNGIPYLQAIAKLGKNQMVWLLLQRAVAQDSWKQNIDTIMQAIEDAGLMDHIMGFYFDEPLLWGISRERLIESTKYMREKYPDLRVFSVFAVNAIEPQIWSNGNDQVLDPETLKYHTDVGYDMYWDAKTHRAKYNVLNAKLKEQLGDNNARIWWVPCIANMGNATQEQFVLDHLEMCFDFIMDEENPGGLMCFAYDLSALTSVGTGFNGMQSQWTKTEKKLVNIGKELLSWNE